MKVGTTQAAGAPEIMTRDGRFVDRDAFTATGWCSIERALELIGTRSAMMLFREAFYGGRRFDDLASRTGSATRSRPSGSSNWWRTAS